MPTLGSQAHLQVAQANTRPKPAKELAYTYPRTEKYAAKMKDRMTRDKNGQLVTGGCCQWRGSTSYDSDVVIETFVLRRKFSDEPPNSTPPER